MARRRRAPQRPVVPDPKFGSVEVARLIHRIMERGKKSIARRIVYDALATAEKEANRPGAEVLEQAMRNTRPMLEVKPRRVGGATYQVPVEVRPERSLALAHRWIITAARARGGRPMAIKLSAELLDAARGQGNAVRRKEELHRMAEANRAFVHYRW